MAKEIVWTETAVRDRLRIYQFWLLHNRSQSYSERLERLFNESAKLIAEFPEIGPVTDYKGIRVKTVGNHKLFYKPSESKIEIIRVWDTRQNPADIDLG
jgi:toxin YoeB